MATLTQVPAAAPPPPCPQALQELEEAGMLVGVVVGTGPGLPATGVGSQVKTLFTFEKMINKSL